MSYYCRECCKFVRGPRAKCRYCGNQHSREHPATEEAIPLRRPKRPKRDGWEHLLGRRRA